MPMRYLLGQSEINIGVVQGINEMAMQQSERDPHEQQYAREIERQTECTQFPWRQKRESFGKESV